MLISASVRIQFLNRNLNASFTLSMLIFEFFKIIKTHLLMKLNFFEKYLFRV